MYYPNPDLFHLNREAPDTPYRFKPGGVIAVEVKRHTSSLMSVREPLQWISPDFFSDLSGPRSDQSHVQTGSDSSPRKSGVWGENTRQHSPVLWTPRDPTNECGRQQGPAQSQGSAFMNIHDGHRAMNIYVDELTEHMFGITVNCKDTFVNTWCIGYTGSDRHLLHLIYTLFCLDSRCSWETCRWTWG